VLILEEKFIDTRIPEGNKTIMHFNPELEIVYVKKGSLIVGLGTTSHNVCAGKATIVMPYFSHSFSCSNDCESIVLMFTSEIFHDFYEKYHGLEAEKHIFEVDTPLASYSEYLLNKLSAHNNKFIAEAMFNAFICSYVCENNFTKNINSTQELLPKIVEYIYENIETKIDLDKLSAKIGYTKRKLSHLFFKQTLTTLPAFINLIRIDYAKSLLKKTNHNITEISQKCGFNSIRSFNRRFLAFTGKTPSEFRKGEI